MAGTYVAKRGQDDAGIYRAKCRGLANKYGFDLEEVWFVWQQLAACHEYEFVAKLGRDAHEQAAWRMVEAIYLKHGSKGD